ncbi:hypothetical protein RSAG8_04204, partial [Rhizoctonia solani AG-8 WAC10335]
MYDLQIIPLRTVVKIIYIFGNTLTRISRELLSMTLISGAMYRAYHLQFPHHLFLDNLLLCVAGYNPADNANHAR